MVQMIVVAVLLLADLIVVAFNMSLMRSPLTVSLFGAHVTTGQFVLPAGAGVAFVLIWAAGAMDRVVWRGLLRKGAAAVKAMTDEVQNLKAAAYDQERPPLDDIRARLEYIQRDLQIVTAHLGGGAEAEATTQT
jgi:hypothetical protein